MKAVMLSIQPKWCELIASGKKTIEVRKTAPKLQTPFKCYIYCTAKKIKAVRFNHDTIKVKIRLPKHAPIKRVSYAYPWFQKVIGEFVCDEIEHFTVGSLRCDDIEQLACLSYREMLDYFYKPKELDGKTVKFGYGWHISDLKIYDTSKELGEFRKPCPFPSEDCTDCPYMDWDYDAESDEEDPFCTKRITHPPMSWCYVEELSE